MTSFLDELRAVRENVLKISTLTLDVPGAGGVLAVRYRPPTDRDKLTPLLATYKQTGVLTAGEELQLLVDCCDEILRRPTPYDEYGSAEPDGGPLRFDGSDDRWGPDVDTARECVSKLFNLDQQPLAAIGHADNIMDWIQGIDAEVAARAAKMGKGAPPATGS